MTRLLDLDKLPTRADVTIKLNGKRHAMRPLTLGDFIAQQKLARKMKDEGSDIADEFEAIVDMICTVFPTIERAELIALSMEKVDAIFQFFTERAQTAGEAAPAGE